MHPIRSLILGIVGAIFGGSAGYVIFFWLVSQGLYGLVIPGIFLGIGAHFLARTGSIPLGIVCAVLAFLLGLFTEWRFAPFMADKSIGYFMGHIASLKPMTLIMISIGSIVAFWLGKTNAKTGSPESAT